MSPPKQTSSSEPPPVSRHCQRQMEPCAGPWALQLPHDSWQSGAHQTLSQPKLQEVPEVPARLNKRAEQRRDSGLSTLPLPVLLDHAVNRATAIPAHG